MRVDRPFSGVLTADFLVGDMVIVVSPDITTLNLNIGEWWYGTIDDLMCSYMIKVERTATGYEVTQGACGTTPCDAAIGACLEQSPCGECCDALDAAASCAIETITSTGSILVTPDPQDCTTVAIEVNPAIIPTVPPFCEIITTDIVTTINPNSMLFFCENGVKYGILMQDLCAELVNCTGGNGSVTIINNPVVGGSGYDANLCGLSIIDGIVQSAPTDWCLQFVTPAQMLAAISAISSGVLSVAATFPVVDTGTVTAPNIGLSPIFPGTTTLFGGSLVVDTWGRVLSGVATTPWLTSISSGDVWTAVAGSVITHTGPGGVSSTLPNGMQIDARGHVVGLANNHRVSRWSGNASTAFATVSTNIGAVNAGPNTVYSFVVPMSSPNYFLSIHNPDGTPVAVPATGKNAGGFTLPASVGTVDIFCHD